MTPQLKSYYILHQNRIFRGEKRASEYFLDEMSDLQLSGNARLMRLYLFLASNSCCFPYFFCFFLLRR